MSSKTEERNDLEKLVFESEYTKDLTQEEKEGIHEDLEHLLLRNDGVRGSKLADLLKEAKEFEKQGDDIYYKAKAGEKYWWAVALTLPDKEVPIKKVLGYLEKIVKLGSIGGYKFERIFQYPDIVRNIAHDYVQGYKPPVEEEKPKVFDSKKK